MPEVLEDFIPVEGDFEQRKRQFLSALEAILSNQQQPSRDVGYRPYEMPPQEASQNRVYGPTTSYPANRNAFGLKSALMEALGQPSAGIDPETQALEVVEEPVNMRPWRQMITGSTRRMYQPGPGVRNYDFNGQAPPPRVVQQAAPMSELMRSIQSSQREASQITGYDPSNPPQVNTLTVEQVQRLSPMLQHQYFAETEKRGQRIKAARDAYLRLADDSQRATFQEHLSTQRKNQEDAGIAKETLNVTTKAKEEADAADAAANQAMTDWKVIYQGALSRGEVGVPSAIGGPIRAKPTTKVREGKEATTVPNPVDVDLATTLNTSKPKIEGAIATAKKAKAEADRLEAQARDRVIRTKGNTTVAKTSASSNQVVRITRDGRQAIFDATTKRFIRYAQ